MAGARWAALLIGDGTAGCRAPDAASTTGATDLIPNRWLRIGADGRVTLNCMLGASCDTSRRA